MSVPEIVAIVAFCLSQIAWVFSLGAIYGRLSAKLKVHDDDIAEIKEAFTTPDGEQRLITYAAHDELVARCLAQRTADGNHIKEDIAEIKLGMKEINSCLRKIEINQAAHYHRRATDSPPEGVGEFWG